MGSARPGFFQKAVPDHYPDWMGRVDVDKAGGTITHVVVHDEPATLVYLANQACITAHAWLSTTAAIDQPDRLVLDLDPSTDAVELVRAAARDVRSVLEEIGLTAFIMTTGSRGFHVVSPITPELGFDGVRTFARDVADVVVRRHPRDYTMEWPRARRGGRVFLDYLRNGYAQTTVAPYAVRARPSAPVATPIDWGELAGLAPDAYTITSVRRRLSQKSDPWEGIDARRRSLTKARRILEALVEQEGR